MASINGVQIKSLKSFVEHEGMTAYQGNVYIDGKKAGFWTQDFCCGADHFHFPTDILDSRAAGYRAGLPESYGNREYVNAEVMLGDLVALMEDEKRYKRKLKEGFTAMIEISDGHHVRWYHLKPADNPAPSKEDLAERYAQSIDEVIEALYGEGTVPQVRIHASLDDFDLVVDDEHPAFDWRRAR